jgi:hypothetical protein
MTETEFNLILKKHSNHEVMKATKAVAHEGKQFELFVKANGAIFTFKRKSSFEKYIRDYDKANKPKSKKR